MPDNNTRMRYLDDTEIFKSTGSLVAFEPPQGMSSGRIVLDETIFYPQGGGQPTDTGIIRNGDSVFTVQRVSYDSGIIYHSGTLESGTFSTGDVVDLEIDSDRRMKHAKLHTGGHLVMTAVDRILQMPAIKGYHFPDGPYVEFLGTIPAEERPAMLNRIQDELTLLIAENSSVTSEFVTPEELQRQNVYVPAEIPAGKPTRVVITSGYKSPCGGTHVKNLGELAGLKIRGIKVKSGHTRMSYAIDGLS